MELVQPILKTRSLLRRSGIYLFAALLSVASSLFVLQLWKPELLQIPFQFLRDDIFYAMTIKSMLTTGWYLTNPMIGAPGIHTLADFPTPEGLNYLLIKLLTFFSSNWVIINNLFFLLTFPLITLSALFVMRRLGLRTPYAISASLLFALLPYHFMRGTEHLFLSAYYTPPLAVWLSSLIYTDELISEEKKYRQLFGYLLACIFLGSTGVYYAYFGCFFLLISGLIASFRLKQLRPLAHASVLILLITTTLIANLYPNLAYRIQNGPNPHAYNRQIVETELYGLKIAQLILPIDNDRIAPLARIKKAYTTHNICNENTTATLGLIGSIGFFILIASLFKEKKEKVFTIDAFTHFTLSGLLLATVGGISSVITVVLYREIRCYNRISVYLAFFAIGAFFFALQKILEKKQEPVAWIFCMMLTAFGIFNQTSRNFSLATTFPARKQAFIEDKAFFTHVDQQLAPESMIFQLPYLAFPEGDHPSLISYDHFRAPLHSNLQKWSFGTIKGRPTDVWQRTISQMPLTEMLKELAYMGFSGLYLNRNGYADQGLEIEMQLFQILQQAPFENKTASFWDLRPFIQRLKQSKSADEWNFHVEEAKKQIFR
ncbi:MAG: hypothetical protein K2P51_03745 [Rhabdochlamydiaceae bacterium]|nr:hypothetical protein [Rhabdochlamydiaceae bacterium]